VRIRNWKFLKKLQPASCNLQAATCNLQLEAMKPLILIAILLAVLWGCEEDPPEKPEPSPGKIMLEFRHMVDGELLQIDTMIYTNAATNDYLVTELQYFISDVILHGKNVDNVLIDDWKDIHYVDNDISSTMQWSVFDPIPNGQYDSISFTFGISKGKNISLMYVNPPERDMFWPEVLGGGYHYMKLNGKWSNDTIPNNLPFEFHMGTGQVYSGDTVNVNDIIAFVHNDFKVEMDVEFGMTNDMIVFIPIVMNIENWFKDPNIYDHGIWGDYIMQNQEAMNMAVENGANVFSVGELSIMVP